MNILLLDFILCSFDWLIKLLPMPRWQVTKCWKTMKCPVSGCGKTFYFSKSLKHHCSLENAEFVEDWTIYLLICITHPLENNVFIYNTFQHPVDSIWLNQCQMNNNRPYYISNVSMLFTSNKLLLLIVQNIVILVDNSIQKRLKLSFILICWLLLCIN